MPMAGRMPSWKNCENSKKLESKQRGCRTIDTGIGSDFLEMCPDSRPTFVEVKEHCGSISSTQRATKAFAKRIGLGYRVDRCSCPADPLADILRDF